jgi:hypothetical protein
LLILGYSYWAIGVLSRNLLTMPLSSSAFPIFFLWYCQKF